MQHPQPTSPVIPGAPTRFIESLDISYLVERYRQEVEIDVTDYFHGLSKVDIYACTVTGYRFYYPFTVVGREDLYTQLARFSWYYTDRPEHAIAERYLRPSDRVLEIGCGAGFFLRRLAARRIRAVGLDLNRSAVANCRDAGLDAHLETIEDHAAAHPQAYDAVCAFHILEHVVEVHRFLKAAIASLRPGGKLIIAVPNSAACIYGVCRYTILNAPPHHMGLWEPASLRALARGFPLQLKTLQGTEISVDKREDYLNFSLLNQPALIRKRDWILWRLHRRQDGNFVGRWAGKLMLTLWPKCELLAVFRRQSDS
ncbi:MAG: class I SAM-dependent methyltransferase [Acidobacteriota bacterium]